jgi:hypothetical protein
MALVVPYNSAMRLGQGFNSYTHALCLDQAVSFGSTMESNTETDVAKIPQTVTYSSHFVDKLSDVVKALNVSAALSVKVGTVTGSGSGGYIDEDKIKESDINFIVQVKVTNKTIQVPDDSTFNGIKGLDQGKFTDIYGDTFISGFVEGGEFVGVVSMKVKDSSKVQDIKAQLEVGFSAVQAKGSGSYIDQGFAKDTETSISVNWSGGGQIKDPNTKWDMETMLRVAAQFPDLCAACPQRTSAILTKYSNLMSFIKFGVAFNPLSYENAGVYTSDLLDDYMDYKVHWKTVRLMQNELNSYVKSKAPGAYEPTPGGLDDARKEILKNMVAIVAEVDEVRATPEVAIQCLLEEKDLYLKPTVFASRLPIKIPPPVDKAEVPPPQPIKPDAKTWQWACVPGRDSEGGDIERVGTGAAPPEELMLKAYEWEAANPGKFVKAFNTSGWLKSKLNKTAKFTQTPVGQNLYVRVLLDDTFAFVSGTDSPGNDVSVTGFGQATGDDNDIDILETLKLAKDKSEIMCFNSLGWAKSKALLPAQPSEVFRNKPHQGTWVRRSLLKI